MTMILLTKMQRHSLSMINFAPVVQPSHDMVKQMENIIMLIIQIIRK